MHTSQFGEWYTETDESNGEWYNDVLVRAIFVVGLCVGIICSLICCKCNRTKKPRKTKHTPRSPVQMAHVQCPSKSYEVKASHIVNVDLFASMGYEVAEENDQGDNESDHSHHAEGMGQSLEVFPRSPSYIVHSVGPGHAKHGDEDHHDIPEHASLFAPENDAEIVNSQSQNNNIPINQETVGMLHGHHLEKGHTAGEASADHDIEALHNNEISMLIHNDEEVRSDLEQGSQQTATKGLIE